jgi:hypothetical protein
MTDPSETSVGTPRVPDTAGALRAPVVDPHMHGIGRAAVVVPGYRARNYILRPL